MSGLDRHPAPYGDRRPAPEPPRFRRWAAGNKWALRIGLLLIAAGLVGLTVTAWMVVSTLRDGGGVNIGAALLAPASVVIGTVGAVLADGAYVRSRG
jgi:hypothetical protein